MNMFRVRRAGSALATVLLLSAARSTSAQLVPSDSSVLASGQPRFPLVAIAADRLVFPPAGIELTFDLAGAGPAPRLTLRQAGGSLTAGRSR